MLSGQLSFVKCVEVQRYLMQFSDGELTKADGIGFVPLGRSRWSF